jgi:hypothetical protein
MTTRKKSRKGKGKRNGRTKRGGFLGLDKLFDNSFPWFGNKSETPEKPESTESTESTESGEKRGWFSTLLNKLKPPVAPSVQPIITGRPPMQQQQSQLSPQQQSLAQQQSLSPQQQPQVITPSSQKPQVITPSSQKPQVITPSSQTQPQMQPQAPVTAAAAGGKRRRNRVSAKKRK